MQASDWEGSEPQFNPPTSHTLAPGGNLTVGVRMFLADSPRHRDAALAQAGYAVARAVPGAACAKQALARAELACWMDDATLKHRVYVWCCDVVMACK